MPKMTPSLDTLFCEAIEIADASKRADFLARVCGPNEALRIRVEALIAAHFRAGNFLEQPAVILGSAPVAGDAVGTEVGPYQLLDLIGEGGMGLVYVAQQRTPVRRTVALKLVRPGMDSREVMMRFEAERQALALMDHPNIAKVLDAGTTDSGRPYFVMELVRGVPITEHCDQGRLSIRERLIIFAQVCRAVHHAHTKGVIHRDIKPTNILVTSHDGVPTPVVIDFGVAKALGPRLTEQTLHTGFLQVVGTPPYMSPEQAEFNQTGVDARSDVYSLGVVLYELLTGALPFDTERLRTAGFNEFRRIVSEEDPLRPCDRVNTLGAKHRSTVSSRRAVDVRMLLRTLRGDPETICLKCLEKQPSRRYATAALLAEDVRAFLDGEPIQARATRPWERVMHWVRRRQVPALMAGIGVVIGVALAGGLLLLRDAAATPDANAWVESAESQRLALLGRRLSYAETIRKVAVSWQELEYAELSHLLDRERPAPGQSDIHGFEWHFLKRAGSQARRLGSKGPPIHLVGFFQNGMSCLAAGERQDVRTWDLGSGRSRDWTGEQIRALSDDVRTTGGMRAISVAKVPTGGVEFRVWEVATGRSVATFTNPQD